MRLLFTVLLIALFLSGCAGQKTTKDIYSGFLSHKYYDKLAKIESPKDQIVFRYISPAFKASSYHHIIVSPVIAFPKPQPTEQVSMKTLQTLQSKLTRLIEDSVQKTVPLSQSPGPGVLRLQTALTALNISDKALAFYEYIPVGLVAASASKATGTRDQEVRLFLEARLIDSVTKDVLAVGIREVSGEDLKNAREKLQAQNLNRGMSEAGLDMTTMIKEMFSK